MRPRRPERGFTLFELLVALAVFAVLSVMAYGGLRTVLDGREATDAAAERLAEVQTALLLLGRDLRQAVARPVRDEYGDVQPPLLAVHDGFPRLALTRGGQRNPLDPRRSALQRVAYDLEDDVLHRLYWQVLDRAQDSQPIRMRLLGEVEAVQLRFLDEAGSWHDAWPPFGLGADGQSAGGLPLAAELSLDLTDWGRVTRLFALTGATGNESVVPPAP